MKKKVVLVGCGFGGLNVAKGLADHEEFEVLILDRRNHHLFQPLLYQVAMAGLSSTEISSPIRSLFRRRKNVRVLLAEVTDVRLDQKVVHTTAGNFEYDILVLACGAEHSYFGRDEWENFAPGLKTLEQAMEIRRRVLTAFERAEAETNLEKQRALLTFAVVGGGPTGVELAGALGELTFFTLKRDFRNINPRSAQILLIEAGPRILSGFSERLSQRAVRTLQKLNVEVKTGAKVNLINKNGLEINGSFISACTVIWAAGVKPSHLNEKIGTPLDPQGRLLVDSDLSLPGHPNVFVLGDQARTEIKGKVLPGLAPVAIQQGEFVAKVIRSGERSAFHYFDKGQMATIGRKRAVVEFGPIKLAGFLAWLMWLVIHVYFLIGFKNRFFVIWEWTFSYFNYRKGARLITRREWQSEALQDPAAKNAQG